MKTMQYWLMKSEPSVYSIDDLKRDRTTWWEGVRNYQARNFMQNEMKPGDVFLFYHSNADPSGVAGLGVVQKAAQPDKTAQDRKNPYFDPKSTVDKPIWYCVGVQFKSIFPRLVSLEELKQHPKLKKMMVTQRGSRLSIQPVQPEEFRIVCELGGL